MTGDVDLAGAAAFLHRSYTWMGKNWRRLAREEGFPPPFVGGEVGGRPWWRVAAIEAWKDARCGLTSQAVAPGLTEPRSPAKAAQSHAVEPPSANDAAPRPITPAAGVSRLLAAAGGGI